VLVDEPTMNRSIRSSIVMVRDKWAGETVSGRNRMEEALKQEEQWAGGTVDRR
jgi:hypothetical protein